MWPAVLAVAACALLASPATAADAESSMIVPGPGCSTVHPGGHELCGEITLQGGGKIHYYFELGTGAEYDTQIPPAPGTELDIAADEPSVTVHEPFDWSRLAPNTTYYYRLAVLDSDGTRYSSAAVFTTPVAQAGDPPTIESTSVSGLTETDATLNAVINPNGRDTVYKLQIDTTGNFRFYQTDSCALHAPNTGCATVIVPGDPLPAGLVEPPESSLPAGTENQHVSVDLASIGAVLQPGTTYHYRAIAANSDQLVAGPDQTFTTLSSGLPDATLPGQPPVGSTAPASLPAVNPAPSVSHPRRGKHKRHGHRRHKRSARSTRAVRR